MKKQLLLILILFQTLPFIGFFGQYTIAQNKLIDSLKINLSISKADTNKVNYLNALAWVLSPSKADTAILLGNEALELAQKIKWKKGEALALGKLGVYYAFFKADFPKALDYYLKSLKLAEQLSLLQLQTNTLGNLAVLYKTEKDFPKALEFFDKTLKLSLTTNYKQGILVSRINLASLYNETKSYDKAIDFAQQALTSAEELGDKKNKAAALSMIGAVYMSQYNNSKALEYFSESLLIAEEIGDENNANIILGNLGTLYLQMKDYQKAEKCILKSLSYAYEFGNLGSIKYQEQKCSELYELTKRPKLALEHYKKYIIARDSIFSEENTKKLMRSEMNYEFEKKEAVMNEQQEKERAIAEEKDRFQNVVIYSVVGGLFLVIAFAFFVFRSLKQTRVQKHIIEEKQKEILDSIHYAKRIQTALITSELYIQKHLTRLYKP